MQSECGVSGGATGRVAECLGEGGIWGLRAAEEQLLVARVFVLCPEVEELGLLFQFSMIWLGR